MLRIIYGYVTNYYLKLTQWTTTCLQVSATTAHTRWIMFMICCLSHTLRGIALPVGQCQHDINSLFTFMCVFSICELGKLQAKKGSECAKVKRR